MADKNKVKETMGVQGIWNVGAYRYKAPRLMEEYTQGLKEKKIIGSWCRGCAKVIVPPRNICGRCHRRMDERLEVSQRGTVTSYIISPPMEKGKYKVLGMDPVEMGVVGDKEIIIPAFVRFDGSDSNSQLLMIDADLDSIHVGMRVKAVWADEPQGTLGDLLGVTPLSKDEIST